MKDFAQLASSAEPRRPPPLAQWNPPFSGTIDIRIARDGQWFHEGRPLRRRALVQLFASILRRESDGAYYLVTPVEKWRIQVDDLPLRAIDAQRGADGRLVFTLDDDEQVCADEAHPVRVAGAAGAAPQPAIAVRHGLEARIVRSLFYRLVDLAEVQRTASGEQLVLRSGSCFFNLGCV